MSAVLSSRLPGDLAPNAHTQALQALRARGTELLDLTETNPTRVGIAYPPELLTPLADRRALRYDPHPLGLLAARECVARELGARGLEVSPSHVALTASTSEAYGFLFKLLCDPGDAILVPRPSYPLFEHLTRLESVRAVPYHLEYHGTWRIDLDHLAASLDRRVKAVLVVSPNNPTGSYLHRADLERLLGLVAERRIPLLGDEVFADYDLDPAPQRASVLEASGVLAVALGGLSKSVGLPQLKLGWAALHGPSQAVSDAMSGLELIADTYLSVATPVQLALPQLLGVGAAVRENLRQRTRRNLGALRAAAARWPAVTVLEAQGGWSAVVRVPSLRSEEALVMDLLTEEHVLVHPGYYFDFAEESYVVVSLLPMPGPFDRAVERMLRCATREDAS